MYLNNSHHHYWTWLLNWDKNQRSLLFITRQRIGSSLAMRAWITCIHSRDLLAQWSPRISSRYPYHISLYPRRMEASVPHHCTWSLWHKIHRLFHTVRWWSRKHTVSIYHCSRWTRSSTALLKKANANLKQKT